MPNETTSRRWLPAIPEHYPGPAATLGAWEPNPPGVPNFGEVVRGCIYRSGQPSHGGFAWVIEQGFRSVVSLRLEGKADADRIAGLPGEPETLLFTFPWRDEYPPPSQASATSLLDLVSRRELYPMLIHCKGGEGRAEIATALIRYAFDGWDHQRIINESLLYRKPLSRLLRGWLNERQRPFLAIFMANNAPAFRRPNW